MDILSLNKIMTCPKSDIKLVGHVIDTGVNPVGSVAGVRGKITLTFA